MQVATKLGGDLGNVWYVDLAPISQSDLVPVTLARALGLPNQPGGSPIDGTLRSSLIVRPCWCSTIVSICWTRLLSWWRR